MLKRREGHCGRFYISHKLLNVTCVPGTDLDSINLSDCNIFPLALLISHYSSEYNVLSLNERLNIPKMYSVLFVSVHLPCFSPPPHHLNSVLFSCPSPHPFLTIEIFSFIKSLKCFLFHKDLPHTLM